MKLSDKTTIISDKSVKEYNKTNATNKEIEASETGGIRPIDKNPTNIIGKESETITENHLALLEMILYLKTKN